MFDEWRERRRLKKKIASLQKEVEERKVTAYYASFDGIEKKSTDMPISLLRELSYSQLDFAGLETERLMRKVRRLGIELPKASDWWFDDSHYGDSSDGVRFYLTETGRAGVSKLIREERRKSIEWWVKIITPILGAIISLLGLIVALVSVSTK